MRRPQTPASLTRLTRAPGVLQTRAVFGLVAARLRRSTVTLVGAAAIGAIVVGLGLLPARTWLAQNEAIDASRAELDEAQIELERLTAELELLQTDDEIERQARQNFDLVFPGEESYRILPAPED